MYREEEMRSAQARHAMIPFAFLLSSAVLLVVALIGGLFPFGNATLLCDANRDYVTGLEALRSAITDEGFFHSFSRGLGGGCWAELTALFANPLTVFVLAFPAGRASEAFFLITILKMGCAGMSCYLLLMQLNRRVELCMGFSVAYGGCMGFLIGMFMPQTMDAVIFLPAIGAGILRLVSKGRVGSLFIALALFMLTSWQLWSAAFLFSIAFFAWASVAAKRREDDGMTKPLLSFIFAFVLAFGTAAFIMIPAMMQRAETGTAIRALEDIPSVGLSGLFSGMFMNSRIQAGANSVLYCSAAVLVILPVYLLNSAIRTSERAIGGGMLALLFFASCFSSLGMLFEAFTVPAACECGVSFVFCVMAAAMCARGLSRPGGITVGKTLIGWLLAGAAFVISLVLSKDAPSFIIVIFTVGFLTLYAAMILVVMSGRQPPAIFSVVIMLCIFIEAATSGVCQIVTLKNDRLLETRETYSAKTSQEQAISALLSGQEKSADRHGISRVRGGTDILSSCDLISQASADAENEEIYHSLGINGGTGWNELTDSLFGVRYELNREKTSSYTPLSLSEGINIYENENALSIGFAASDITLGIDLTMCSTPFTAQELFVSAVLGEQRTLYVPAEASVPLAQGAETAVADNGVAVTRFDKKATLTYSVFTKAQGKLYMYLDSTLPEETRVSVNGGSMKKVDLSVPVYLGTYAENENAVVTIEITDVYTAVYNAVFSTLVPEQTEKVLSDIAAHQLTFVEASSDTVNAVAQTEGGQMILTTIPYSKCWSAAIDGKPAETKECCGGLMAIMTEEGQHTLRLSYVPEYLLICIVVSALSILCALCWIVYLHRREQNSQLSKLRDDRTEPPRREHGDLEPLSDDLVRPVKNHKLDVDLDYESEEHTLDWL